jgi:hypothetical protein
MLADLVCIIDKPEIPSVEEALVSSCSRSDPGRSTDSDDCTTIIRSYTRRQEKHDTANLRDRVSALHPIRFERCATDDEPSLLDLSVFRTPAGGSKSVIEVWNAENFAYTEAERVTEIGRLEQQLPRSTVRPDSRVCHVYL